TYTVQPDHHFAPPGSAAPAYAVPVTNPVALVLSAPVKVAMPAVAIAEFAAGVQSNADTPAGTAPCAGSAVKSAVLAVLLLVSELPARSSAFCGSAVPPGKAWNGALLISVMNTLRISKFDVVASGTPMLPPRANVSVLRSEMPATGKRANTP